MSLEARVQRVVVRTTEQRAYINFYLMYHDMLSPFPASFPDIPASVNVALRDGILRQEQMADGRTGSRSVVHSLLLTVPFALIGKQLA